ncbi:cupin domain-containing protein [Asticcacaulis solisilvae]|uniref:cupin domain-containing protein n=1 Tax=Asticcacaulis solisilvae TaxID=1217274 RepID=UPI003FD8E0CA
MIRTLLIAASLLMAAPAFAQDAADHTTQASAADIKTQVAAMMADMKPGQGFMWRSLLTTGGQTAGLEIWKAPGRPAIHTAEAEYFTVVQGTGTLVTGGTMVNPKLVRDGFVDGDVIQGGTTRQLKAGDFVLIPAGVPHWFGIPGEPLVLLGIKVPVQAAH